MANIIMYCMAFIFLAMLIPWFAYMFYVTVRDDRRSEKERKYRK